MAWHDFSAERGGDYGREWNASLGLAFLPGWNALVNLADDRASGFGNDTTKLWLQLQWSH